MKITISGVASVQNSSMTKFMQACDIFEPFKVAAVLLEINYVLENASTKSKSIEELREYFDEGIKLARVEFGNDLVFCHIQQVQQDDIKIENTSVVPFVVPNVSVVSDGEEWGLVVNHIKHFCKGIKIEEGELRKIKSLTWK